MSTTQPTHSSPTKLLRNRFAWIVWVLLYLLSVAMLTILLFFIPRPLAQLMKAEAPPVPVAVPRADLPAFHIIRQTELQTVTQSPLQLPAGAVISTGSLSGTISLMPLASGKVITDGQILVPAVSTVLTDSVIIALEVGPALVFGDRLRPGDQVAAWQGTDRLAERLLVLDIQRVGVVQEDKGIARYIVVVAAPLGARERLIAAADTHTLSFALLP